MSDLIRYQQHENGVHEITFLEKSRASVDAFYQKMQDVYESGQANPPLRLLVDLSLPGIVPMQYMFRESQNWRRRILANFPIRIIILYPEKGVLPIARALVNAVLQARGAQIKLRLENVLKREEALEWLMGDKS
jgi:hypothetical protein